DLDLMEVLVLDTSGANGPLGIRNLNVLAENLAEVIQSGTVVDRRGAKRSTLGIDRPTTRRCRLTSLGLPLMESMQSRALLDHRVKRSLVRVAQRNEVNKILTVIRTRDGPKQRGRTN